MFKGPLVIPLTDNQNLPSFNKVAAPVIHSLSSTLSSDAHIAGKRSNSIPIEVTNKKKKDESRENREINVRITAVFITVAIESQDRTETSVKNTARKLQSIFEMLPSPVIAL